MSKKHKFKVGDMVISGRKKYMVLEIRSGDTLGLTRNDGETWVYAKADACKPFKAKNKASKPTPMPCHGCACQKASKPKETAKEAMPEALPKWAIEVAQNLIDATPSFDTRTGLDKQLAKIIVESVPVTALEVAYNSNYIKELEALVDSLNKKVDRKSEVINQLMLTIHNLS